MAKHTHLVIILVVNEIKPAMLILSSIAGFILKLHKTLAQNLCQNPQHIIGVDL